MSGNVDNKRDPELLYWHDPRTEQSVNLSQALHGVFRVTQVYGVPDPPVPAALDACDRLQTQHPRARIGPPFRRVEFRLDDAWDIHPGDEMTLWLPEGFYIGFVSTVHCYTFRMEIELLEAGYCLLNGYGIPYDPARVVKYAGS